MSDFRSTPMEKLLCMPPEGKSDMELYAGNCCTREEIAHQNSMIKWRNEQRLQYQAQLHPIRPEDEK